MSAASRPTDRAAATASDSGNRAGLPRILVVIGDALAGAAVLALAGWAAVRSEKAIAEYPLWGATVAAAAGSLLTLAVTTWRRRGQAPPNSGYRRIPVLLRNDDPKRPRHAQIDVLAEANMSWADVSHGVAILNEQILAESWTPDLVVALNTGDVIVALLRTNERLRAATYGSLILDADGTPRSVSLPPKNAFTAPVRTLVVDCQLKRGLRVHAALQILKEQLDVQPSDARVAVVVLGDLRTIPLDGQPRPLSDEAFEVVSNSFAQERLDRVYYVAFVCDRYARPPWRASARKL